MEKSIRTPTTSDGGSSSELEASPITPDPSGMETTQGRDQRRLKKAMKLVNIVKEKYKFEREVSTELARRNEVLRAELEYEVCQKRGLHIVKSVVVITAYTLNTPLIICCKDFPTHITCTLLEETI